MAEFGFAPSKMDGSEHVFGFTMNGNEYPSEYSYRKYLPKVLNQGEYSICVPCSISAFLNWKENLNDGSQKDNKIDYFEIYNKRTNNGEGMTFKEAFAYLRHNGVKTANGNKKIGEYALIHNAQSLKEAILMNGPCVGALPVYNYEKEFWNQRNSDYLLGYHAISICGYDSEGFIIRNSWGTTFADKGYTKLKYKDFNKLVEVWTIID